MKQGEKRRKTTDDNSRGRYGGRKDELLHSMEKIHSQTEEVEMIWIL